MSTLITSIADYRSGHELEWNQNLDSGWAAINVAMSGNKREYFHNVSESRSPNDKPRLPNFSNFVAGVGHPDLVYRTEGAGHDASSSYTLHPFPPPSASSGNNWNSTSLPHHQAHLDPSPQFTEYGEHDGQTGKLHHHRQQSAVIQSEVTSTPRPIRSYSFTEQRSQSFEGNLPKRGKVVREETVHGRGVFYVYEDGSVCPKVVNGDAVNPKWGTTKAGKPRKRLGQACNTCREKKIKCDPSFPKCSQCQKFGRDCRFETQSRSGQKSPKSRTSAGSPTSSNIAEDDSPWRRASTGATDAPTPNEDVYTHSSKGSITVDRFFSPTSTDRNNLSDIPTPSKRMRLTHHDQEHLTNASVVTNLYQHEWKPSGSEKLRPKEDPIMVDNKTTHQLLEIYFTDSSLALVTLFPRENYLRWAHSEQDKTIDDVMVLYAILALTASVVRTPEALTLLPTFVDSANLLLRESRSRITLQSTQTCHLLSLMNLYNGDRHAAFQFSHQACASALTLRLNTEGLRDDGPSPTCCSLADTSLAECRRRTFWSIYILDCHVHITTKFPSMLQTTNILLPFPTSPEHFERDVSAQSIYFDGEEPGLDWVRARSSNELDMRTFLIQIVTLCNNALMMIQRTADRFAADRQTSDTGQRSWLDKQLKLWEEDYRSLRRSKERNAQERRRSSNSDGTDEFGSLSGVAILCYFAQVQLNRYFHHGASSNLEIISRVRRSHSYATKILEHAQSLVSRGLTDPSHFDPRILTSCTALATFTAIDIITAAGTVSDVLENRSRMMQLIYKGLELLGHIAERLPDLSGLHRMAEERIHMVYTSVSAGLMDRKVAFYINEPMRVEHNPRLDAVYGINRMQYLQILDWAEGVGSESDLLKIVTKK